LTLSPLLDTTAHQTGRADFPHPAFGQGFAVSGQSSANGLVQSFQLHPLSLSSVIAAYEQQRRVYFVNLISPGILLSDEVQSFDDLVRLADGPLGQMDQTEVKLLAADLEARGVFLRYVKTTVPYSVPQLDCDSPLTQGEWRAMA
jgi:hypothetical protein